MASDELKQTTTQVIELLNKEYNSNRHKLEIDHLNMLYQCAYLAMFQEKDIDFALRTSWKCKWFINKTLSTTIYKDIWGLERKNENKTKEIDIVKLYYELLKLESYHLFESFIFYMEKNREQSKRFYLPRKKTLYTVVQDLQDLENRKFKFYGLSMPSRVGKSTTCIFFLAWIALKRPNSHSAMAGHSGSLAKGFYKEMLNLINTKEYTFEEMYKWWHPNCDLLADKSSEEYTLTLDMPDRFATLTCRGIDGTWTGAIDVSKDGFLYVDDLVRDREESLSPVRMEKIFQEYLNKMVDRKNDGARELMVGTLWNVFDPLERIRQLNKDNPEYRFRKIPALNEKGESNFNYDFGWGFSTEYYLDIKERLDNFEWMAKYQQQPFVREGLVFPLDELRYFNGVLPDGEYRTIATVDVAYGGGDSLSMPIGYEFENGDVYIVDWVFSKGAKEQTIPQVVGKIIANGIMQVKFEGNQGGDLYCDYVDTELRKKGYKCSCSHQKAPSTIAKTDKIMAYSGDIKRNFIFIQSQRISRETLENDARLGIKRFTRTQDYQHAMEEMGTFVSIGKNPHDDAVDGLTQLAMELNKRNNIATISAMRNPFRGGN